MTAAASSDTAASASSRGRAPAKRSRRAKPQVPSAPGVARIIAIANQKGGVGKSTTAVSLGASLADIGYRVLVLDLDPQGNASTGMGIRHEAREVTVYDVVVAEAAIDDAIVHTAVERLDAVPSTIDLAGAEIELVSLFSREGRLKRSIEPVRQGRYDFILLDCPPSLGLLTVNALTAAEELIVPIQCEYYALEGLGQLLRNVGLVQQNINPGLRLAGIVMTMFDPRTKLSEQVVAEVRRFFGDLVYDVIIPRTVRLSEAPGFGQPITLYDPRSKGAEAYRELAREVAVRPAPDSPIPAMEDLPTVVMPAQIRDTTPPEPIDDLEEDEEPPPPSMVVTPEVTEPPPVRAPEPAPAAAPVPAPVPAPGPVEHPEEPEPGPRAVDASSAPDEETDEVWEDIEEPAEPRVRPVAHRPDGEAPRRVVVIDEGSDLAGGADDRGSPAPGAPGSEDSAEIGATLHDDLEAGKRRWRLFRKGGEG